MREGQASGTAERVAIERAVHQLLDRPIVFADPLAIRMIGADAADRLRAHPEEHDRSSPLRPFVRAIVVVRSRLAEDEVARGVAAGVAQYVILGAGLDTFAYRNPHPALRVFEVDHPATQARKRERLAATGLAVPDQLTFVACDFGRESMPAALDRSGFDRARPAVFAWLGVVMYLEREAVMETLAFIGSLPERTAVIFDYALPPHLFGWRARWRYRRRLEDLARRGEPWISFFEPAALRKDLVRLGLPDIDDLSGDDINRRFLANRTDALRAAGAARLVVARK